MEYTVEELYSKSTNLNRIESISDRGLTNIRCNVEWYGHPPLGDVMNDEQRVSKLLQPWNRKSMSWQSYFKIPMLGYT